MVHSANSFKHESKVSVDVEDILHWTKSGQPDIPDWIRDKGIPKRINTEDVRASYIKIKFNGTISQGWTFVFPERHYGLRYKKGEDGKIVILNNELVIERVEGDFEILWWDHD